jgi:hypothetical protein
MVMLVQVGIQYSIKLSPRADALRASPFLLLVQKKETKEKDTPDLPESKRITFQFGFPARFASWWGWRRCLPAPIANARHP